MKTYPLLQSQLGIFMEWSKDPSVTQYNCLRLLMSTNCNRLWKDSHVSEACFVRTL